MPSGWAKDILEAFKTDPIALWVWQPADAWRHSHGLIMLVDLLVRSGLHPILHRWKFLKDAARRKRVWARPQCIPSALRKARTTEGEVARGLYCFAQWRASILHQMCDLTSNLFFWHEGNFEESPPEPSRVLMLLPPCRNCGTPTGRWCESCRLYGRNEMWEQALCSKCDGPTEDPCVHCLRDVHGTVIKL